MKITLRQLRRIIQEELGRATREKESMLNEFITLDEEFNSREEAETYRDRLLKQQAEERDPGKPHVPTRRFEEYEKMINCVNGLIKADVWPAKCARPAQW